MFENTRGTKSFSPVSAPLVHFISPLSRVKVGLLKHLTSYLRHLPKSLVEVTRVFKGNLYNSIERHYISKALVEVTRILKDVFIIILRFQGL